MTQEKINRINELAKIAKERELTSEESTERAQLRQEYINEWKNSLQRELDNTYIIDSNGKKTKLRKK